MIKIVKKRFDLQVPEALAVVSETFILDKNIVAVKGILLTSDKDDLLYFRGSQKIEINKEELFPDNYESKLLMSGINVPPLKRYYDLGKVNPGNGKLYVQYVDKESADTDFGAYRVSIYLECEVEDSI